MTDADSLEALAVALERADVPTIVALSGRLAAACDRRGVLSASASVGPLLEAVQTFARLTGFRRNGRTAADVGADVARAMRGIGSLSIDDVRRLDSMGRADLERLQRLIAQRLEVLG